MNNGSPEGLVIDNQKDGLFRVNRRAQDSGRECGSTICRTNHYHPSQLPAEIYGRFTEGFDTKELQETKALLDELLL